MANPTTNFGWVMPTSASLVTNLPADFNTFGQAVDTSMSELLGGTTGQVLSKTSNTNMDFTWVTPTDQTPLTTKGDLFTFTTVDARLGVGTNGQYLQADSTAATGLAWATPASGSGMTLISRTTFSGVASQTFDGVFTTTYENYIVYFNSMSAATSGDDPYLALRYAATDVAGSVYFNRMAMNTGSSTVTGSAQSGTDFINMAAATGSGTEPGYGVMYFGNVGNVANKGNGWGQWNDGANGQASWFNGSFASGGAANKICTGFKVYSSSSNVSGTVTIYGLAKS